jgi:glycerophosphoryl diester phosphodiesterase
MDGHPLLRDIARMFRSSCKALVLTDIAFKLIAFIVLTPLVGVTFRGLVALSGRSILADQDIVYFFMGPVGWVCFIAVGSLWLGIIALEQSALMAIMGAAGGHEELGVLGALQFAARKAWPVVQVAARMLALTLLAAAPFAIMIGLVYFMLLTEYDINYYLARKPTAFWVAAGLGGICLAGLTVVLLRFVAHWFFALPLVLFENISSSRALHVSRARVTGHRRTLLLWLAGWVLATVLLSALATSAVVLLGRMIVSRSSGSLELLVLSVGLTLTVWIVVNVAVSILSTTTFAAMLFGLYRHVGSQRNVDWPKIITVHVHEGGTLGHMSRRRLTAIALLGTGLATAVGIVAIRSVRLEDRTAIIAHRGSSAAAPENTLAAIRKAIEDRADWVEIDVQETADGEVVLLHDSDFMKVAGVNLKIWDATLADLDDIDVGGRFAPEYSDERVPLLTDVLAECRGRVGVIIELKYYGRDQQLEQRVIDAVEARGMGSEVAVMSLNHEAVRKVKSLRPGWKVGLLTSVAAGNLMRVDADFFAVNTSMATRRFIRSAHRNGKEVYAWTVNDAATMSTMMGRNVDGLITDRPALARSVLLQRAHMSVPERLLLELAGPLGMEPELGEP